jgi:hypothetical protein
MTFSRKQRAFSAALVALSLGAAFAAEERKERARLPPELEPLFGIALAAPPEFASSALLRLDARVTGKELRRDLIDMAFHLAAKAQNPVRLTPFRGVDADTRTGNLGTALNLKMDALSLQSHAVEDMLRVDPARARELFGEIARSALAPASCEDSLLPDVSPYYEALAAVVEGAFTPKERAGGEHLSFATAMLSRVSSIAELGPAARMLVSVQFPRPQFEIALGSYTSRLDGMPLDNRSFLHFSKSFESEIAAVVERARALGASPDPLIETYRKFLVTQFRGPRCSESGKPGGRMVQAGNTTELFGEAIRGDRPPLRAEELAPERVDGEMKLDRYWQSGPGQRIFQECMKLRQGPAGYTVSDATRRSHEWSRQLTDFLGTLANWRPSDEASEADYYHQKAIVYEALIELAPSGDLSSKIIAEFVDFLKSSNVQQSNAVEWFWHARSTVQRAAASHPEQAAQLLAAYRASGNIVLVLEAMLGGSG